MILYAVIKANTDEIVYIGQTISSVKSRRSTHMRDAKKGLGSIIGAEIRRYGIDSFYWKEVSKATSQDELCEMEVFFISKFKPRYNIQEGGKSNFTPWNKGYVETRPEVKERISKAAKNRKRTKRGYYSKKAVDNIRNAKLKSCEKSFICHQNGKIYKNKVEAAIDLEIKPGGISAVLCKTTNNKTVKGYSFEYLTILKGD